MQPDIFEYDHTLTYLENFIRWRALNNTERDYFNERYLTVEESEVIFSKLYGDYS